MLHLRDRNGRHVVWGDDAKTVSAHAIMANDLSAWDEGSRTEGTIQFLSFVATRWFGLCLLLCLRPCKREVRFDYTEND